MLEGWICPICKIGVSPYSSFCPKCSGQTNPNFIDSFKLVFGPSGTGGPNTPIGWPYSNGVHTTSLENLKNC